MNRKYFYILTICLLLISNFVLLYFVFQKTKGGFHPDRPKNIIIKKLQFDERQIASYQKLIDQHRKDIRENDHKILSLKNELYSCLSNKGSASTIDSLTSEIGKIQKQIETIHFNHFLDIKGLCTSEQLPKFEELSKELSEIFNHKNHLKPPHK